MKHFEFKEGTSSKFWEVSVDDKVLIVKWGRIGTVGQSKTKSFPSNDLATQEERALIAEKLAKGYVAVYTDTTLPPPKAEETIITPPPKQHEGVRAVLKDSQGETIILTQLGRYIITGEGEKRTVQDLSSTKKAEEHFKRLTMLREKNGYKVSQLQQVTTNSIEPPNALETAGFEGETKHENGRLFITFRGDAEAKIPQPVCDALVARIEELAPRCVQLLCDFASPKSAWERALKEKHLLSVKSFVFDTHFQTQTRQGENSLGDLDAVLNACPKLRNLFATGDLALNPVTHPNLKTLYLLGNPLSNSLLENLGKCQFPALDCLALSLTSDAAARNQSSLVSALASIKAPNLKEVHIGGIRNVPQFLTAVLAHNLPPQIRILSIEDEFDCPSGEIERILQKNPDALRSLEVLSLPLDEATVSHIQQCIPCIREYSGGAETFLPKVYGEW